MRFIARWLVCAIACAVAIWLVPGINYVGERWEALLVAALVLSLINCTIAPVLKLIAMPISCLTLGIFALVLNGAMLELASYFSRNIFHVGITIDSLWSAVLGAIIISIVTAIVGGVVGVDES